MINESRSRKRGYVPGNSHKKLVSVGDLVAFQYTCFHCGNSCHLVNGYISDHESTKGKCWASGKPNPYVKPPRDPKQIRERIYRRKRREQLL